MLIAATRCTHAFPSPDTPMFTLKIDTLRKCMHTGVTNTPSPALARHEGGAAPGGGGCGGAQAWRSSRRPLSLWGGGWGKPSECDKPPAPTECPNTTCNQRSGGFFDWLFAKRAEQPPEGLPDPRCCRRKYCRQLKEGKDPDLSQFGGKAYKTCGHAYVIQRDRLQPQEPCHSKEDQILRKIETNPDLHSKIFAKDPLMETDDLCGRWVEMADKKLHPLYKKLNCTPPNAVCAHRAVTGPIDYSHLPSQICINRSHLEKKNLYWSHKLIAPPANIIGRLKETKPILEPHTYDMCRARRTIFCADQCGYDTKRNTVFDTLKQRPVNFVAEAEDDQDPPPSDNDECSHVAH